MPTQEERLTAVENDLKRFKSDTVKSYQDVVVDLAMVKGLALGTVDRLTAIRGQIEDSKQDMIERFERQDRHFEAQDAHLDMHDKRFDDHDKRFDALDKKLDQVLVLLANLTNKL